MEKITYLYIIEFQKQFKKLHKLQLQKNKFSLDKQCQDLKY